MTPPAPIPIDSRLRFRLSTLLAMTPVVALAALAARPIVNSLEPARAVVFGVSCGMTIVLAAAIFGSLAWRRQQALSAMGAVRFRVPAESTTLPYAWGGDATFTGMSIGAIGTLLMLWGGYWVATIDALFTKTPTAPGSPSEQPCFRSRPEPWRAGWRGSRGAVNYSSVTMGYCTATR